MSSDAEFLRSLADEIDGSELTHSWRRDRDWLREIATKLAAAEAALAACEADTARLDWLEANCDMILNHEQLTQDEYRSPAVICCLPEDRPLRESIDAWLAPRP